MKREIVKIDNNKCNGCGDCVPNCHEGALQIIDGKAVLISDLLCDGLGACLGHCPTGALTIEKREAEPYNEFEVMADMVNKGKNAVIAHLVHLKDHNEKEYLKQGFEFLEKHENSVGFNISDVRNSVEGKNNSKNLTMEQIIKSPEGYGSGCPGSRAMSFNAKDSENARKVNIASQLTHWPIQLHLINPAASIFIKADLLVAADCTAFSFGNFHEDFLKNRKVVIACPKLDSNKEIYIEKISRLIDEALVHTITVLVMEVPCCSGLFQIAQMGMQYAKRKVPLKTVTIGIRGEVLREEWV
jgi:NAD-dependent dihydropyrimidine dehydrogenase PreA subunit